MLMMRLVVLMKIQSFILARILRLGLIPLTCMMVMVIVLMMVMMMMMMMDLLMCRCLVPLWIISFQLNCG